MTKRRSISMAVTMVFLLGIVAFAAMQISETARGTISASNVQIEVVMLENIDDVESPVTEGETVIMPGSYVSRIAKVKNTGDQPAWVRVKTYFEINGTTVSAGDENDYLELTDVDTSNWTYQDGYWYYSKPLEPGETSPAIFKGVEIKDSIDSDFDETDLKVDGEGTQVKNNGNTVFEAEGWPAE